MIYPIGIGTLRHWVFCPAKRVITRNNQKGKQCGFHRNDKGFGSHGAFIQPYNGFGW